MRWCSRCFRDSISSFVQRKRITAETGHTGWCHWFHQYQGKKNHKKSKRKTHGRGLSSSCGCLHTPLSSGWRATPALCCSAVSGSFRTFGMFSILKSCLQALLGLSSLWETGYKLPFLIGICCVFGALGTRRIFSSDSSLEIAFPLTVICHSVVFNTLDPISSNSALRHSNAKGEHNATRSEGQRFSYTLTLTQESKWQRREGLSAQCFLSYTFLGTRYI